MKRRMLPIDTRAQVVHTLAICMIGLVGTMLVAVLGLYFLNVIHSHMVTHAADPDSVVAFLQGQSAYIYYGLLGLFVISIVSLFVASVRFTNKIFGPFRALDRDLKKQTFLGQFDSGIFIRRDDFSRSLVREYRQTCEDLNTVYEMYQRSYEEIDEGLEKSNKKKRAA